MNKPLLTRILNITLMHMLENMQNLPKYSKYAKYTAYVEYAECTEYAKCERITIFAKICNTKRTKQYMQNQNMQIFSKQFTKLNQQIQTYQTKPIIQTNIALICFC